MIPRAELRRLCTHPAAVAAGRGLAAEHSPSMREQLANQIAERRLEAYATACGVEVEELQRLLNGLVDSGGDPTSMHHLLGGPRRVITDDKLTAMADRCWELTKELRP